MLLLPPLQPAAGLLHPDSVSAATNLTPLLMLLKHREFAAAQLLVDAGADAMCVGDDGATPLTLATAAASEARDLAASLVAAAAPSRSPLPGAGDGATGGTGPLARSVTLSTEATIALARHRQAAALLRSMSMQVCVPVGKGRGIQSAVPPAAAHPDQCGCLARLRLCTRPSTMPVAS